MIIFYIYFFDFCIVSYVFYELNVGFISYTTLAALDGLCFIINKLSTLRSTYCQDFPRHKHTHTLVHLLLYGTRFGCLVMLLWALLSIYAENLEIVENFGLFFIMIFKIFLPSQLSIPPIRRGLFSWDVVVVVVLEVRYFCFWLIEWVFEFGVGFEIDHIAFFCFSVVLFMLRGIF